jgi:D-alanyl-D-alanine carboxypeptidase
MRASRVLRLSAILVSFLAAGAARAGSTPVLVADLDSGKVLYSERATDPWYPASITKLMTTYVALQEARSGKIALDALLTVTPEAARLPPSKMGFKPGTQIRLDNALKIIMVKSANDVAMTVAEGVGGSVEGFAALMNRHAERLGMRESHFVNPHGLPDDRQQTSARDMAMLARALLVEFPDQKELFSIGAIQYGRQVMKNHNGLIGRYPGAFGMKTGYICASGFNVVAAAERGGRRLVTVVLGSPSARERTLKSASLLDYGFSTFGFAGQQLNALPPASSLTPTDMRPLICGTRKPTGEDDGESQASPVEASVDTGTSNNPTLDVFAPTALAFSGSPETKLPKVTLAPRAPTTPVLVWTGLNPPSAEEIAAANQPAPKKKRAAKSVKPKSKKPDSATAKATTDGAKTPAKKVTATPPVRPQPKKTEAAPKKPETASKKTEAKASAKTQ